MKTVTKIALIALLWILVINSGMINADATRRLQMTHAWWTGTEEISPIPNYQPKSREEIFAAVGVIGRGNKRYIPYEPGQSLLMLPGDWIGTKLHRWFPKTGERDFRSLIVNLLIFVPLNVAAVVACFWLLKLFDFEERIAGLTSIVWLLGTTVLHYAQIPQQNNQILLFVTLGYAAALAYVRRDRPHFALLSGLALGATFLIRMTSIIHVFTVLLFFAVCVAYQSRNKLKVIKSVGLWIVGFIPLVLLGRVLDYIRFGSFWTTGNSLLLKQVNTDPMFSNLPQFPPNWPFNNEPWVGIFGVLFSPAKSIFIYDPLLLPCLGLGIVFWKQFSAYTQWYIITGIFNLGFHLAFYSRFLWWHGDAAWGARYHLTSVHLLLIPLLGLFIQLILSTRKSLIVWAMRGILSFAILVQIASVILAFSLESAQGELLPSESRYLQFRLGQRFTNIACQINCYFTNSSFAEKCVTGSLNSLQPFQTSFLTSRHQVALLPFNYVRFGFNRKWIFIGWISILTLAIISTVWFCFFNERLA